MRRVIKLTKAEHKSFLEVNYIVNEINRLIQMKGYKNEQIWRKLEKKHNLAPDDGFQWKGKREIVSFGKKEKDYADRGDYS